MATKLTSDERREVKAKLLYHLFGWRWWTLKQDLPESVYLHSFKGKAVFYPPQEASHGYERVNFADEYLTQLGDDDWPETERRVTDWYRCGAKGMSYDLMPLTDSLDACRLAEQEMQARGLKRKYLDALGDYLEWQIATDPDFPGSTAASNWAHLVLDAETRCRAMLDVLEPGWEKALLGGVDDGH